MMRGTLEDIVSQRDLLSNQLSTENAVDLIYVRTRLPIVYGANQGWLDSMGVYFMPFMQPSVLRIIFQLPLQLRRNAKLVKNIIRAKDHRLARYPLVSETTALPFFLPRKVAVLLKRAHKRLGLSYRDSRSNEFLEMIKPFVLDLVHSRQVSSSAVSMTINGCSVRC